MNRSVLVSLVALAAAASGCGSMPQPSTCQTAAPIQNPCVQPSATPGPGTTPPSTSNLSDPPEGPYVALPGPGTVLSPGHYAKHDFVPSIWFAVRKGWTTVQQLPGFFDIQDDPGSLDVVAVQFTRATGFQTAEDAAAGIESRENLVVGDREEVTIAELAGIRIEVDTTDAADTQPVIFRPVLNTPPGPISIGSGRRLQVNLFTLSDGVLAILVGGSISQWDRALELSTPVLESLIVSV